MAPPSRSKLARRRSGVAWRSIKSVMRLPVEVKLVSTFVVIIILTGVVGAVGYWKLLTVNDALGELASHGIQMERLVEDMSVRARKVIPAANGSITFGDDVDMSMPDPETFAPRAGLIATVLATMVAAMGAGLWFSLSMSRTIAKPIEHALDDTPTASSGPSVQTDHYPNTIEMLHRYLTLS